MTGDLRHVAVLDIGKTNVKAVLHDLASGADTAVFRTPNHVRREGPYPHYDVDGIWGFFLSSLGEFARDHGVDAISITTHGASAVLLDSAGELAFPVLDYEHDGPQSLAAEYDAIRPAFAETKSPRLPNGLNLGAQIFWLERTWPDTFERVAAILTYPQYWSFRLTGIATNEVTSLGCHTDLWAVGTGAFSSLVEACGWRGKMAPVRPAFTPLGLLRDDIAGAIGGAIPVFSGLHDSNASLLPHLGAEAPFSVLSTGTWVVAFAVGGAIDGLDPARDTLANVDAFGRAVPSGRFMGGREFELLTAGTTGEASEGVIGRVLDQRIICGPGLAEGTGPFPSAKFLWSLKDPSTLTGPEKTTAASLYLALMSEVVLGLLGAQGPMIIEGPLGQNRLFCEALAGLTGRAVEVAEGATGTSGGAALLATGGRWTPPATRPVSPPAWAGQLPALRERFLHLANGA